MSASPPPPPGLVVVKVGGSLFDHPDLAAGLTDFLEQIDATRVLLVAGGGPFADAIRTVQKWQGLADETAHALALAAITPTALLLDTLLQLEGGQVGTLSTRWWEEASHSRVVTLHCGLFLTHYEGEVGPVPHTWDVTTDSIAALAASVASARLILLKSTDIPPGTPWPTATVKGWVDEHFPTAVAGTPSPVQAINFRKWLNELYPPATGA